MSQILCIYHDKLIIQYLVTGFNKDAVYAAAEFMRKEEVFVLEYGGYAIILLFAGGALQVFNFNDLGISILCASIFAWGIYVLYDSTSDVVSMFSHNDNDENNISMKKYDENGAGICDILKCL